MMLAVDFYLDKPKELIIVTPEGKTNDAERFIREFRRSYLPNKVLMVVGEGEELRTHGKTLPLVRGKRAMKGRTTAYVCEEGLCRLPTSDPNLFAGQIAVVEALGT
jgi:uncharacterized protein YyaL (SSP411 family)